ncbi:50S ribosomal protein L13, partial [Pseudomonas sp. NPDC086278]|uniref:50S ribosomal protein L13 n=1 Tax=Pseudomonas sp. NPDC086278 TaxID=3390646 RepID=UPI003D086223
STSAASLCRTRRAASNSSGVEVYLSVSSQGCKIYYSHSGFPGGIKSINFEKLIAKAPERVIETAVKGMLPKNPLGRDMYRKLKVYAGAVHPHTAQQPQELKF